jgi:hypothetical protein
MLQKHEVIAVAIFLAALCLFIAGIAILFGAGWAMLAAALCLLLVAIVITRGMPRG